LGKPSRTLVDFKPQEQDMAKRKKSTFERLTKGPLNRSSGFCQIDGGA